MSFRRRWMAKSETPFPQRLRCDANERVACRHENRSSSTHVGRKRHHTFGQTCVVAISLVDGQARDFGLKKQPPQSSTTDLHPNRNAHAVSSGTGQMGSTSCVSAEKHRFCRQERRDGSVYCGNHQHLPVGLETNPMHFKRKRIRCPIDPSHYIFEDNVEKHCTRCPLAKKRKKQAEQPYYHENLNAGGRRLGRIREFRRRQSWESATKIETDEHDDDS